MKISHDKELLADNQDKLRNAIDLLGLTIVEASNVLGIQSRRLWMYLAPPNASTYRPIPTWRLEYYLWRLTMAHKVMNDDVV